MKKRYQILIPSILMLFTAAFSFAVDNTETAEPDNANIIYAFDVENVMSDADYSTVVASGGTCTADCSGCWTNECTTSNISYCGSIQGTQSGKIIKCYRGGGNT